jgi:anti-sigma B factor antagonist
VALDEAPADFDSPQRSAMSSPLAEFALSVQRYDKTAVVRVVGELDLATTPTLSAAIAALEQPCDRIVLDLSDLVFIDSTGLSLAVAEYRRATRDGFDLVVAGADGHVLDVLRLTGLDVTLPLAPDVRSALGQRPEAADEPAAR